MEYLLIGLCLILLILMGIIIKQAFYNSKITRESKRLENDLKADAYGSQMELKAAKERLFKVATELEEAYVTIQNGRREKLKNRLANGYTSEDLKKQLRFLLPDKELAHTVRVKYSKDNDEITASVRKKVEGKFTDVEVNPVIVTVDQI